MNRNSMFGMYDDAPLARMTSAVASADSAATAAPAAAVPVLTPPAIGDYWPGQGGEYAGLSLTDDGLRACHLILALTDPGDMNHGDAEKFAAGLEVDGHKDFTLANRVDGLVLFRNMATKIGRVALWLKETYASGSGCAWYQGFSHGYQGNYREGGELRARAVRRLPI